MDEDKYLVTEDRNDAKQLEAVFTGLIKAESYAKGIDDADMKNAGIGKEWKAFAKDLDKSVDTLRKLIKKIS